MSCAQATSSQFAFVQVVTVAMLLCRTVGGLLWFLVDQAIVKVALMRRQNCLLKGACFNTTHGAHGVVVSHPLSMREALGSIPSVSILICQCSQGQIPVRAYCQRHDTTHNPWVGRHSTTLQSLSGQYNLPAGIHNTQWPAHA